MTADELIDALQLPLSTRVDQRIPKKTLVEHGAPTAADKRYINDGTVELHWIAALKPSTIGVPEYRDTEREYLEIAVLMLIPRAGSKLSRLVELIHRAVPYPTFLIVCTPEGLALSLAHKRLSQGEAGKMVLDSEVYLAPLSAVEPHRDMAAQFKEALSVASQPRGTLHALYQGWIDTLLALEAALLTKAFTIPRSAEYAEQRRAALTECARLESEMGSIRKVANKEKQIARRVDLNLRLKQLQKDYESALSKL